MSRITVPTPTRGRAPSHSPPDVRYAPGLKLARALGWASLGLGLVELLAPRRMAQLTGVQHPSLIKGYGIREIATGIGILTTQRPTAWMWGRVAGDVTDLATIGEAMIHQDRHERSCSTKAAIAIAGVLVLDTYVATSLSTAAILEG
jgi:hypothetical protein